MSIEYTIDIQLTELGFPEIVPNSPGREAGSQKPGVEQRDGAGESPGVTAVSCTAALPSESARDERGKGSTGDGPAGTAGTAGTPAPTTGRREEGDDDSDDSDVSDVYEEEEVDDNEEEDGSHNDSSHPWEHRCTVCDLQFPSQFKLQDHMNLHTGARPYCCAECGKRFCQIYSYRVHLRTHAEVKVERLVCRVCRRVFYSQGDLEEHLSCTHLEKEFFECDLCKQVFTSLKECESHVQLHTYAQCIKCNACGRTFPSAQALARHQRRRCHRLFKCTDCGLIFTKKNALLKHSFSHLGLLPYTCLRCHCHFRLAQLYRHHKCEPGRIHCVACLREFLCQGDFEQHKKDTGCWGNQEPKTDEIRCLECGERFETKDELKKHAGAHQRVLTCAECGKGFRSALLLMSHMGGHAGNSPCLCQSCGLGFPHQQNYESHLKTCGQTPVRAPKKRPAGKSFSPLTKTVSLQPIKPTAPATKPAKKPARKPSYRILPAPAANASIPGVTTDGPDAGTERGSPRPGPPDGSQLLSLNKDQPSAVKLLLFVPVCLGPGDGAPLPSAVSPTLPLSAAHVQPQQLGIATPFKMPLLAPLDFVTKFVGETEGGAPLDLSMKCGSSAPDPQSGQSETAAPEDSGEGGGSGASRVPDVSSAKTETSAEEN